MAEQITQETVWAECDLVGELELMQRLAPKFFAGMTDTDI